MRIWASVGAWQNERISSPSLLSRGAAQRRGAGFVSTATAPHASSCHDRRSLRQRRQLPPVLPPCAHPYPPCAAFHSFAREHTRALRAHVRHFPFFAFTSSPLCRKSLYDSRFGVKVFPKMLHRGEASAPHPPSGCNRPTNDGSTRTHPGGENHEKPPAKCRKAGATAPRSPTAVVKAWVKRFPVKPSPLTV